MKKAYWIAKYRIINNREALENYARAAKDVIESFGGKALIRGGQYITIEGEDFIRTVVWEFKNIEVAKKCHDSNQYQSAWSIAKHAVVRDLMIVEGI